MSVKRTCMALDLKDEESLISEYEQYHRQEGIWPEIPLGIKESGIFDMQIFRIGTRLFMIVEYDENTDLKTAFEKMSTMPRQQEWSALMAGFQKELPGTGPGEHWATMTPVFLLNDHIK